MSLQQLEQRVQEHHWDQKRSISSIYELVNLLCWRGLGAIPTINAVAFLEQEDGTVVPDKADNIKYTTPERLAEKGYKVVWKKVEPVRLSQDTLEAHRRMARAFDKDAVLLVGNHGAMYKSETGAIGVVREQFDSEATEYTERHVDIFFTLLVALDVYKQMCQKAGVSTETIDIFSLIGKDPEFGWLARDGEEIQRHLRRYDFRHSLFERPRLASVGNPAEQRYTHDSFTHTSIDQLRKKINKILSENYGERSEEILRKIYGSLFEQDTVVLYVSVKDGDTFFAPQTGLGPDKVPGFDDTIRRFSVPVPESIKEAAKSNWKELLSQGIEYRKLHKKEFEPLFEESVAKYFAEMNKEKKPDLLNRFTLPIDIKIATAMLRHDDFFARVFHFLGMDGPVYDFKHRLRKMKNALIKRNSLTERTIQSSVIAHFIYKEVCNQYGIEFTLSLEDFVAKSLLMDMGLWKKPPSEKRYSKLSDLEIQQILKGDEAPKEVSQDEAAQVVSQGEQPIDAVKTVVAPVEEPVLEVVVQIPELAEANVTHKIFTKEEVIDNRHAKTKDAAGYTVVSKFDEYRAWLKVNGLADLCYCFFLVYMNRGFDTNHLKYTLPQHMEQYQSFYDLLKQAFSANSLEDISAAFQEIYTITEVFPDELAANSVFDLKECVIDPLASLEKLKNDPKRFAEELFNVRDLFKRNPYMAKKLFAAIKNGIKLYWEDKESRTIGLIRPFFSKQYRQSLKEIERLVA